MSCQQLETTSTLEAMRLQEITSYRCHDYLHAKVQKPASPTTVIRELFLMQREEMARTKQDILVCMSNRAKMAQWCMALMDACELNRETVSVAMSVLDRFLATPSGSECIDDSASFQLSCMTALYSAIKIHEEKAISPEALSSIARGFYTKADMEAMEWRMLQALQWRVNAPTPLAFVREYLSLLPSSIVGQDVQDQLLSLAKIQTELAVVDYNLVTIKPSSIGFAALMNAVDVLGLSVAVIRQVILSHGHHVVDMPEVFRIQSSLYACVANMKNLSCRQEALRVNGADAVARGSALPPKRHQSHTISPRAVCQASQIA